MKFRVHWGVAVALFYTAFALSTVGFVAFAMTQEVQLVSDDYYARSLEHDAHVQAMANADALGPALAIDVASNRAGVRLQWPSDIAPLVRGTATMYRPSNARADKAMPLGLASDGTFVVPTGGLQAGRWRLKLQWRAGDRDYYVERELTLP